MARCGRRKYPQIAYIDRNLYYKTDRICEMVPRRMPDGVINTFVPREIMPDGVDSANFGRKEKSLEYMFLESGELIINFKGIWYYCEKEKGVLQ